MWKGELFCLRQLGDDWQTDYCRDRIAYFASRAANDTGASAIEYAGTDTSQRTRKANETGDGRDTRELTLFDMATQFAMLRFELKSKLRCTAFFIRTKDPEDPVKILKIKTLINDVSIHYPSFFPRLRAPGFNTVLTAAPSHAWLVRQPPRPRSLPPTVTKPLCSLCMAVCMHISFVSLPF